MAPLASQYTGDLGRAVTLREGTSDRQVWSDTFVGRYHVPPVEIEPATVLDLGANIGLTAAHYAVLWPDAEIVAVEMDDDCANLARLNAPGVRVECYAVSGEGGWGTYDPGVLAEAFRFTPRADGGKMASSYTLRQIVKRQFAGGCVDFVKMDVESTEHDIFRSSGWEEMVCSLLVELHPGGPDDLPDDSDVLVADATARLESLGFTVERHLRHPRAVFAWREGAK